MQKFIIRRLLADRVHKVVTSASLAEDVAREHGVIVESSCIRKLLLRKGYRWLPRRQKRKYTKEDRAARERFARGVLRLSRGELRSKLAMSMGGVVLSMPPESEVDRLNYCWGGISHMWRKPSEGNSPRLAGNDDYQKQVPLSRAIPLWGGCSAAGFHVILWHARKKVKHADWCDAVHEGKLTQAIRSLNPHRRHGPWSVLCDNETFLRHHDCLRAYAARRVCLWDVPPRSPDLNPIEMFWAWVRRQLRVRDLDDVRHRRAPLSKPAYIVRVKALLRTARAQAVARSCALKLRSKCQKVVASGGAAIDS